MRKIVLCGRGGCCPEVHIDGDMVVFIDEETLQDDFVMKKEYFDVLKEKIRLGEFD